MERFRLGVQVVDTSLGWKLGTRALPRRYVVSVYTPETSGVYVAGDGTPVALVDRGPRPHAVEERITLRHWLDLEIESTAQQPPRCVALRAPGGISTPELRIPLAGIVAEASAAVASRDGTFTDLPDRIAFSDNLFEADRAKGRSRSPRAKTPERLAHVARIARENPRTPTAAVGRELGITRQHARRLIKQAEEDGEDVGGNPWLAPRSSPETAKRPERRRAVM